MTKIGVFTNPIDMWAEVSPIRFLISDGLEGCLRDYRMGTWIYARTKNIDMFLVDLLHLLECQFLPTDLDNL